MVQQKKDPFRLDGRGALVTGAAQGIGQALALGLAEADADVALLDCRSCAETEAAISTLGRRCISIQADLHQLDAERALRIVDECAAGLGRLDGLVNAAGILRRAPALEISERDWNDVLDLDLSAVFRWCQAAAHHFVSAGRGGRILNVASMLSFQGGAMAASYAAAKSGVAGLTRALANEWAPLGSTSTR